MKTKVKSNIKLRGKLGDTMRIALNFQKEVGLTILVLGIISLVAATVYSSSIPALIGLGLVFWGIILTYIQSDEYLKKTVLDSTTTALLTTLNETLQTLDYKGKAIYLPPKYVNDPASPKIYLPKLETGTLPTPDMTQKLEARQSHGDAHGILITPPGAELARLIESTMGTSFIRMNVDDLQQRLPKTLIEDLEVVTDFEIQPIPPEEAKTSPDRVGASNDEFSVKFTTIAYRETSKRATELSSINENIGSPLSSAIAVALAEVTGKPTAIKYQRTSEDGEKNEIRYAILEEQAQ